MRRRVLIIGAVVAAVAVAAVAWPGEEPGEGRHEIFHVTLADPDLYVDGVFSGSFKTPWTGVDDLYVFDFVPNGSSPKTLSIALSGDGFEYSEDFTLKGTRHEAALGEFYTWEYEGANAVTIPDGDTIAITIDPNGSTQGSVSVYLFEN